MNYNELKENNADENEVPEKTNRIKRSSIFHSRRSILQQNEDIVVACEGDSHWKEQETKKQTDLCSLKENEEAFDLMGYINSLREERKAWQRVYKERKAHRKQLKKQSVNIKNRGQDFDLNLLSSSQKSFLLASINYENIHKNSQKLSEIAFKVALLNKLIDKQKERCALNLKERADKITRTIIQMID